MGLEPCLRVDKSKWFRVNGAEAYQSLRHKTDEAAACSGAAMQVIATAASRKTPLATDIPSPLGGVNARSLPSRILLRRGIRAKKNPPRGRAFPEAPDPGVRRGDAMAKAFALCAKAPLRHLILPSLYSTCLRT